MIEESVTLFKPNSYILIFMKKNIIFLNCKLKTLSSSIDDDIDSLDFKRFVSFKNLVDFLSKMIMQKL